MAKPYLFYAQAGEPVNPVAFEVEILPPEETPHGRMEMVEWDDTARMRRIPVKRWLAKDDDLLVWETPTGLVYTLVPMTKAIWDHDVKEEIAGAPEMADDAAVQAYYKPGGPYRRGVRALGGLRA